MESETALQMHAEYGCGKSEDSQMVWLFIYVLNAAASAVLLSLLLSDVFVTASADLYVPLAPVACWLSAVLRCMEVSFTLHIARHVTQMDRQRHLWSVRWLDHQPRGASAGICHSPRPDRSSSQAGPALPCLRSLFQQLTTTPRGNFFCERVHVHVHVHACFSKTKNTLADCLRSLPFWLSRRVVRSCFGSCGLRWFYTQPMPGYRSACCPKRTWGKPRPGAAATLPPPWDLKTDDFVSLVVLEQTTLSNRSLSQ